MIKVRCNHPGCRNLTNKGDGGYCNDHTRPAAKENPNRLRYWRKEYQTNRDLILTKYPYCMKCWGEGKLTPGTADHIIPLADGGTDDVSNLQVLCLRCNSSKGNQTIKYPTYDISKHKPGQSHDHHQ